MGRVYSAPAIGLIVGKTEPGYCSDLTSIQANPVGRVIISDSSHSSFDDALRSGLRMAEESRAFLLQK